MNTATQKIPDGYKLTEVGVIPNDWEVEELRNIVDFKNGKAHENFIVENGKYIVVNSKFISTEGEVVKYSNENYCPTEKDSILMVMSDVPNGRAIAKCFLVDENSKYSVNQRICSLKPKIDPNFLFYKLDRNPYFLAFDDGVKQTNLRKDDILICKIGIPTNPFEQSSIGKVLFDINDLIQKTEKLIAKKKAIKQGAMQELLTGKRRLPGFSGEWEKKKIKDFDFEISDGNYSSKYPKASEFSDSGIPFIRANNIKNMTVIDDDMRYISKQLHSELLKGHLKKDDILITTRGDIGQVAFVPDEHEDSNINAQIVRINTLDKLDKKFFCYFLLQDNVQEALHNLQTGSALKQLPVGKLVELVVLYPSMEEQKVIGEIIYDIDLEIEKLDQKLEKYNQIKQGAMQVLLTGKVRLIKN